MGEPARGWIRRENIKWLVLFFLLAFAVRALMSTMHVPSELAPTDQDNYLQMNRDFFEQGIGWSTRWTTFIMAPLMLFFSWFGFSYLTSTILAGCLISSFTIIPLWMIAEHLNINPKLVSLLYIFSTFELIRILAIGSYTTEFGILFLTLYVLLILKGYYILAPFAYIIPFFSHKSSPLFIYLFLAFAGIYSVIRHRRIFNIDARKWIIWSCAVFIVFGALKFGVIDPSMMSSSQTVVSTNAVENAANIKMQSFHDYVEIGGSYMLILALLGMVSFLRENKSLLMRSWMFAPQILSFVPLFTKVEVSARIAAYGAPSMALLAAYAFRSWKQRHWLMKAFLILMVIGTIYYAVSFSMFQFYSHSVAVWGG